MKRLRKALIVDDEPLAREVLIARLAAHPEIEIQGVAGSVAEARAFVEDHCPDLVFLDMKLPGGLGLELASCLNPGTRIIVVTAFEHYALDAFAVGAADYLLKPVSPVRLALCLERVLSAVSQEIPTVLLEVKTPDSLMQWHRLPVSDILWVEAHQNYTMVQLAGKNRGQLSNQNITRWDAVLPKRRFERISRSLLIQMQRIRTVSWQSRDETVVHFVEAEAQLPLGRTAAQRLKAYLNGEI